MLYFDLTGDAAVSSNAINSNVEERLRKMLTLADSEIIFDLRANNRFNETKFNTFWDKIEAYFNEQVSFISVYLSDIFIKKCSKLFYSLEFINNK